MKREMLSISLAMIFIVSLSLVSASGCNIVTKLINQDPYPAVPGDYVRVVFELSGVDNIDCRGSTFEVVPEYPFSSDPDQNLSTSINSVSFFSTYKTTIQLPYKFRVDSDALDGDANLKTKLAVGIDTSKYAFDNFAVNVKNPEVKFDLILNDYSFTTGNLVLGLINVGKSDSSATVVEIPAQDGIVIKGASKKVIGSLASNDDTTVSFNGVPKDGTIKVNIAYNDNTNTRRTIEKDLVFSSKAFASTQQSSSNGPYFYPFLITWLVLIFYWIYGFYKKRQRKNSR